MLFDFCLAAMEGDTQCKIVSKTYFYLFGLHPRLYLLLCVIINEPLVEDNDIREFLTLPAVARAKQHRYSLQSKPWWI
jgi:hypothetical protein